MKRDYQRAIEKTYKANPLTQLLKTGMPPESIKGLVIETLDPYFTNKQFLREHAIDALSSEAANVGRIIQDEKAKQWLQQLLVIHRQALTVNKVLCLQTVGFWEDQIAHGRNEFWSGALLETDLGNLPLEDFKYEAFRTIGMLIEACLQPLLKALLAQVRIASGASSPNKVLEDRELGKIVDELCAKLMDPELVAPAPWKIRLSQWRNMAQHHKTHVEDGGIVGVYGVGVNQTEVVLSRTDVLSFAAKLNLIVGTVRGARAIFLFDNLSDLEPYIPHVADREDARVFDLAAPLATQGFVVEGLEVDDKAVVVRIRDQIGGDPFRRMAHCSQFLYVVWLHFRYSLVIIDYVNFEGHHKTRISAKGEDLQRYRAGEIDMAGLANATNFEPASPPKQ